MAHTGKISKELQLKIYKEIQDSIFNKVMEAVRLAGDNSVKTNNSLRNITKCVVTLAIEEVEKKYGIEIVPRQETAVDYSLISKIKEDK